jgi:deoxyribose-phosphate aldolase
MHAGTAQREANVTDRELARMIDHTQVRAYATQVDITELCDEAVELRLASVTVNPAWTSYCAKRLSGTGIGVNPTIGFPLGANTAHVKAEETRDAVRNGASELDMVINIGALKSGFPQFVEKEIAAIVKVAGSLPIKVILETGYLTGQDIVAVCEMSARAGAAFVQTSTGFGSTGATLEDVKLMRQTVGNELGVKAAGGIRGYRDAMAFVEAGATHLGTSAALKILAEAPKGHTDVRA